jgi:outer membrane protein assembly factor BamB
MGEHRMSRLCVAALVVAIVVIGAACGGREEGKPGAVVPTERQPSRTAATEEGLATAVPTKGKSSTATPAGHRPRADMPMFRGNAARTGVNPGPGVEDSPRLLWEFRDRGFEETPDWCGDPLSSPVVADGTVYVGAGGYLSACFYALDAATGEERWSFRPDGPVESTPAVAGGLVYFGSGDEHVYALDAATGKERWRFEAVDAFTASPVVEDGVLYVGIGSSFFALDAVTGDKRWTFPTPNPNNPPLDPSPAVYSGTVYLGSGDGNLYSVDALTSEERWRFPAGELVLSTPAVADGAVYFVGLASNRQDEYIYAVDAATGAQRWRFQAAIQGSPAVAGGLVYIGSDDGNVYALRASDGRERWRFQTGDAVASSPTIADGTVYVGSYDGNLYALDASDGRERWRFPVGPDFRSSPAVVDGVIYAVAGGVLYAITGQ